MRHPNFLKHIARFLAIAGLITLVLGLVVQQLWNRLIPDLFHLPAVGFWQAVGLALLGRLLFGRIGRPGHPHGHPGHLGFGRHGHFGGPERDLEIQGGPRGWRRYGHYWKEEGKAHFEAWLQRSEDRP